MNRKQFDSSDLAPMAPPDDPTECPLCGAPVWTKLYDREDVRGLQIRFDCESSVLIMNGRIWAPSYDGQSYACAYIAKQRDELRRLRISQLRRMADAAASMSDDLFGYASWSSAPRGSFLWRMARRKAKYAQFAAACLTEIARLRGEV